MKLVYCTKCHDIFKLDYEPRACKCGECKGAYDADGHHAWTNGNGMALALGNGELRQAIISYKRLEREGRIHSKQDSIIGGEVLAWVRGHNGPSNPRSRVLPDMDTQELI